MKIRAERKPLAETLAWVAAAIPKKASIPALSGMLLTAQDGVLTLRSYDYETAHQARLDVDVVTDGECLVSGHFLRDIVSSLKGPEVELILNDNRLTIASGRSTYRTSVLRASDYPAMPEQPRTAGSIPAAALAEAITTCRGPVEPNGVAEILRGLHFEADDAGLWTVGLERAHIVTHFSSEWAAQEDLDITVPLAAIESAAKGLSGTVDVGFDGRAFGLSTPIRTVITRTLDGEFPKWRAVLRDEADDTVESIVEAGELIEVVKRASMLADDGKAIALHVSPDEIEVAVDGAERGAGTDGVMAQSSGSAELLVTPRMLLAVLAAMPSGPVRLGLLTTGVRPVMVRPVSDAGRVGMFMPRRKS